MENTHQCLGLKLFSINTAFIDEARMLLEKGFFQFVELYVAPQTADELPAWKKLLSWPFVIHGPHHGHGVNLADISLRKRNAELLQDSRRFADTLHAGHIVVHGGFGGSLEEVCRQAADMDDGRFALENVPAVGLAGEDCVCWSPDHMTTAMASGAFSGFVLDVGHALYAANSAQVAWKGFLAAFMAMGPELFHLSDGYMESEKDIHESIGKGNFDLAMICGMLPVGARITLETPRDMARGLRDSVADAVAVRNYASARD